MKGIVFNLLEEVVTQHHGAHTWDALLDAAGLDGAYSSLGSYPDQHVVKLVEHAAAMLELPASAVLRWFGRHAIPLLAVRYPAFFAAHDSTRPFLLSLNHIIHPEVRKVYPGADVPEFRFEDCDDGALRMSYFSQRRLCHLAHGFAEGAADHFAETLAFEHLRCMHLGDPHCVFELRFAACDAPVAHASQTRAV